MSSAQCRLVYFLKHQVLIEALNCIAVQKNPSRPNGTVGFRVGAAQSNLLWEQPSAHIVASCATGQSISIGHLHFLVLDRDLARVRGLSTPSMIIRPSARKLMLSGSSFCARVKHNRTRSSCRKTNSTTGQQRCTTTSYTTWASRRCRRCHSRPKNNDKDRDRDRDRDKATCCLLLAHSTEHWPMGGGVDDEPEPEPGPGP
ncbi:uncharacterized protein RSE6_07221 [Rhynchosporium secalis]|uniref:Uncharacterized protein n=1 Tax=Rhynchosporium secalis TaxID=38038 RepID=A0A1E1MCC8_RHYSE|nr:uncharacterized protein RSE6_07221 [Rhynchosporium secalis]